MNKLAFILVSCLTIFILNLSLKKIDEPKKYIVVFDQIYCKECVNELLASFDKNKVCQGFIGSGNIMYDSLKYYNMKYDRSAYEVVMLPKTFKSKIDTVRSWPILFQINETIGDTSIYFYFQLFDQHGNVRKQFLETR